VGTATVGVGSGSQANGSQPFTVTGKVDFTGPYNGYPFGLVIVTPVIAGPYNLGTSIVRAGIGINPYNAQVTTTAAVPTMQDFSTVSGEQEGVPTRVQSVSLTINREGFIHNPTNCNPLQGSGTVSGEDPLAKTTASVPFALNTQFSGCGALPFSPTFTASVVGPASKANGTTFVVKTTSAGLGQASIAKVSLQLPATLPARLTTLQKACVASVWEANPAACPEGSVIGRATIHTPLLTNPLSGPAYLVSHGGAAFPDVEFVLQGEGIVLILDGKTDIKNQITFSKFESVPDAPFTSFETVLPAGPHSALTANVPEKAKFSLCGTTLKMPTTITGQNGAVINQTTNIAVTGCPSKVSVSLASVKRSGNSLLVTVKTSAKGTVWVSGSGLKKTQKKNLSAGSHRIRVAFTKFGTGFFRHHKKTSVRVKLIAANQTATTARTAHL
jgi:hypothetical protein